MAQHLTESTAMVQLEKVLEGKKYKWVQKFLDDLKRVRAEGQPEFVTHFLHQFLTELISGKLIVDAKDLADIKEAVHDILSISRLADFELLTKRTQQFQELQKENSELSKKVSSLQSEGKEKQKMVDQFEASINAQYEEIQTLTVENEKTKTEMSEVIGSYQELYTENEQNKKRLLSDSELLTKRTQQLQELQKENSELSKRVSRLQSEMKEKQKSMDKFEVAANTQYGEIQNLMDENQKTQAELSEVIRSYQELYTENEQHKKRIVNLEEHYKASEMIYNERIKELSSDRDDLRNRYSKLAGQTLKDNSSGINELSDPNRPMKLGVKFSELYDNEWTDVFQAQVETLKKSERDAIQHLLGPLEECYGHCKQIAEQQMEMLRNVFMYHCQDMTKPVVGATDKPILHSNEVKALLELRKVIASNYSGQVKQSVIPSLLKRLDKTDEKIHTEFIAYFEKCVEVCWLLAVNDPPLYMDMEVKVGGKVDPNVYVSYYIPGDKTDFLVWPPLYNIHKGGLINKGVIAPVLEKKKINK